MGRGLPGGAVQKTSRPDAPGGPIPGAAIDPEADPGRRLKQLTLARLAFALLLLGSTLFLQLSGRHAGESLPLLILYGLAASIFLLSLLYAIFQRTARHHRALSYVQMVVDSLLVTVIVLVTGGYFSVFSFLYLVVIIYSCLLLPRRGTLLIAALCSLQFGLILDLEYYGLLDPFGGRDHPGFVGAVAFGENQALYKLITTMAACVVVAFLSSLLSEQTLKTRRELHRMEQHVKRVGKMAAVGEMAAGLAHEIKNPLASLTGAIQLLREDIHSDPDHDRLMRIILREADRLSSLVSSFLLYARPPAGKIEPIELERILRETVELFGKKNGASGRITTRLNAPPGIWIGMDCAHLRQVLWNLLVNAAEAIEGPGAIRVDLAATKERQACLTISDTGTGIPPESLQSIFDPFFTTKPNGTGLGLSIVHRILETYDCRLDVDSAPGRGTRFSIHFRQIAEPAGTPTGP